jgi:S1-C subfamily serine protease
VSRGPAEPAPEPTARCTPPDLSATGEGGGRWGVDPARRVGIYLIGLLSLLLAVHGAATDVTGTADGGAGRVKSGTGFFVSPDGLVVTSAHVVKGCREISLWPANAAERSGQILAADAGLDMALLSTSGKVPRYATDLRQSGVLAPGAPVATIGFGVLPAQPREPIVTNGSLVGAVRDTAGNPILLIRARLREGNSGGPVIDVNGSLLGVVIGRDAVRPQFAVATPSEAIDRFLIEHGMAPVVSAPRTGEPIKAADLLKAISVLVQCPPVGGPDRLG